MLFFYQLVAFFLPLVTVCLPLHVLGCYSGRVTTVRLFYWLLPVIGLLSTCPRLPQFAVSLLVLWTMSLWRKKTICFSAWVSLFYCFYCSSFDWLCLCYVVTGGGTCWYSYLYCLFLFKLLKYAFTSVLCVCVCDVYSRSICVQYFFSFFLGWGGDSWHLCDDILCVAAGCDMWQ